LIEEIDMKKGIMVGILTLTLLGGLAAHAAAADLYPTMDASKGWGMWDKRVGLSGFTFIKIGQSARAEGMGQAFTAISDDINAAFWNPAGLGHLKGTNYTFNYTRWLSDSKLLSGAFTFDAGFGVIGFNVISFATQEFPVTTPTAPWGTGEIQKAGDLAVAAMFAKRITEKLMIGGQVRWMQEDLVLDKMTNIDFSVGTLFYTGFKSTRLAMGFRNLGPDKKLQQGGFQSMLPATYNVSGAMEILGKKGSKGYATLCIEESFITDYKASTRVGVEAWLNNMLALRAGYKSNMELEDWTLGAGLKHKIKGKGIAADIAWTRETHGYFDPPLRFTVSGSF
jgi:hypothetical protein